MFRIGNIELEKPLALAPMENVSDRTFRAICKSFGADLVYTEFANSEAIIRDVQRTLAKINILESERPIGVQIYGSTAVSMERAAAAAEMFAPDFIDINCGCWVKKIAMRGDGAGLLRDIKKFENVVQSVMKGTSLPVTVKTRLGWDASSINIVEIARMCEQNGVSALTVHCRTRDQAYKGEADWSWLEKIKSATPLPLMGNGDVKTPEDARRMFDTGCDGVMIGRGAIYAPWLFAQVKRYLETGELLPGPDLEERTRLCIRHLVTGVEYKGERRGVLEHRKYYAGYLRNARNIAKLRAELMQYTELGSIVERLERFLENVDDAADMGDVDAACNLGG
ncbi:MAG TPA: tRNA dihydrouridine synthase DusB [Candidatus Bathyarchaeia archaeon]|nr:tRNA dihydrouridine synthase DusB [Candidatus Bathyarchaeia archaeon]